MTKGECGKVRLVMDASAWCSWRGLGRYAVQMATALAQSGEVALAPCAPSNNWGPWAIPPPLRESAWIWSSSWLPWHSLRMPVLSRRLRADAAWFPANEAATWGCEPYVLTLHDVAQAHFPEQFFRTRQQYGRYLRRLHRAVARAARVVTDAEFSRRDISELTGCSPEKIVVVPLGVDPVFCPVVEEEGRAVALAFGVESPYILYVGGFDFRKNLGGLIEAYSLLATAGRPESLVLVGTSGRHPEVRAELQAVADRRGVGKRVVFLEGVVQDDVALRALYNGAALFVFPSLFEGFGLPPLEAMACGTPVVCSTAASLPEVVGEAAVMIDPQEVDSMAEGMTRVLEDGDLRGRLREAGLARAAGCTWAAAAQRFVELAVRPVASLGDCSIEANDRHTVG